MTSVNTSLSQFIQTYVQTISEHPKLHTELEFRIGKVNASNSFEPGYVVPEIRKGDSLPLDPEKLQREVKTFSRLREALESHAAKHPQHWTITRHPNTLRSYHANDLRQSFTQDPKSHTVERKTSVKQLMIHSNGILQVRGVIALEERFHFEPTSPEAISLKQNPPKAVCYLQRVSFTEIVESTVWGNVTFRYDLTKITPPEATKDKACLIHAQYHVELELIEYHNISVSPDHVSYLVELILLRLRLLLGNCIVASEQPLVQSLLPPPILYCIQHE
jgi:hypothetical protein